MRDIRMELEVHRGETPASEDLLSWCTKIANDIYGLDVKDLTTSWKDGMAFCSLIHHFRPDLVDYYKLNPDESKVNLKVAFDAIGKLGIPSMLSSTDLMILDVPDKLSVMTVLHQIRAYFTRKERKIKGLEWDCDDMLDDFDSDGENCSLFSFTLDKQMTDWPSKTVSHFDSVISYTSPLHKANDKQKHFINTKAVNQQNRSITSSNNSKSGEQFNGLKPIVEDGLKENRIECKSSQSSRSIDTKVQSSLQSATPILSSSSTSKTNTQSTSTVQKEKKPLMTRKQLTDPFDSDSDDEKVPKGKIFHRRASASIVPETGPVINDILDLAADNDPLAGVTLSFPTSPDSDPSSSTTSSTTSSSTTPSISTSSSSYSTNLSDTSSLFHQQSIISESPVHRPNVIELAPGLLDVSPKKVSPFQRARGTSSYRSLRLESKRTTPDRKEKLHERARQLIEETRKKKLNPTELTTVSIPADDERRRQLREKARQMLSDQISKMIKEKSPIEPRSMEAAIRDLNLRESKNGSMRAKNGKPSTETFPKSQSNTNQSNVKSPKKSYVDMELMILEKEQSKIDKEAAIVEEKLRLIMKNGGGNCSMEEERCIRKWFTLVNKKNEILRRQMKLNILEQEKDLERCYKILIKKLQPLNSLEDWEKTDAQRETEKLLLDKLLRIVEKRNELVHHLDTEEQAEAEDQMVMKETQGPLNLTASEKNCIVS